MRIMRYSYLNSTRRSHILQRIRYRSPGGWETFWVGLCGRSPACHPQWTLSLQPVRTICRLCANILDYRQEAMQRVYRTTRTLEGDGPPPYRIAAGALSDRIEESEDGLLVYFQGIGEVSFYLEYVEQDNGFVQVLRPVEVNSAS